MTEMTIHATTGFMERRGLETIAVPPLAERRQFSNSHEELTAPARELARAIDEYKLRHRRRFISYEEMLAVIRELGYHKD